MLKITAVTWVYRLLAARLFKRRAANVMRVRYPDLDDFLGSEFIQDPDDHRSLLEVTDAFRPTREPENVLAVAMDVRRFLSDQHDDVETAFAGFVPQIYPPAMGYTVAEFLSEIADLLERNASSPGRGPDESRIQLASEPRLEAASSFRTLEEAESGVSQVIRARASEIQGWAGAAREGATKAFELPNTSVRGLLAARSGAVSEVSGVRIVLKKIVAADRLYHVLTAFPI